MSDGCGWTNSTTDIFWALPVWNGMRVIYLWISDSLFTDVFLFSSLSKIRVPLRSLDKSPDFFVSYARTTNSKEKMEGP